MKPVYLIKHERYVPYDKETHFYELPFEEPVPVEKLERLLEKELKIDKLTFETNFGDTYLFKYMEKTNFFYSDQVDLEKKSESVDVNIVLKIGSRYFECKELDIFIKNSNEGCF